LEPQYGLKEHAALTLNPAIFAAGDQGDAGKTAATSNYADLGMSDLKDHLNHCIHGIKQSIMCHSDVSVGVWQWEDDLKDYKPNFGTEHTCRNFTKIKEWANSRSYRPT
jgi:hypothetical protein